MSTGGEANEIHLALNFLNVLGLGSGMIYSGISMINGRILRTMPLKTLKREYSRIIGSWVKHYLREQNKSTKIFANIVWCKVMFAIIRMLVRTEWYFLSTELCVTDLHHIENKCFWATNVHTFHIKCLAGNGKVMLGTIRSQCIGLHIKSLGGFWSGSKLRIL